MDREARPDVELLAALNVEGDPVPGILRIVDRRLHEGQTRPDVLAALESVYDEDPAPVSEAIDRLTAGR